MRKNHLFSVAGILILTMVINGCGTATSSDDVIAETTTIPENHSEIIKPEKITVMMDGTVLTVENGRDTFEALLEEKLGMDIEFIQPEHDQYNTSIEECFAGTDLPDVVLLSSSYYPQYVHQQLLADLTDYYAGSDLEQRVKSTGNADLIDGARIKGHLYGITPSRGNGCMTYIKKSWLDHVGINPPTNYDEYLHMLELFSTEDPDGDGIRGNTYGVSAAGLINNSMPYTCYLPEFYQDAYPSFYRNAEGVWIDGFQEESMKQALERMTFAYSKGWIDPGIIENSTSDCRDKFYADEYGVFTYWAGTWANTLSKKCKEAELDGEIVALPAIQEVNTYWERVAPIWCITSQCKNPAGVYTYFLETMLDGDEVENLWTYSPVSEDFSKNHIDHLLAVVPLANDPGKSNESAVSALAIFNDCSAMVDLPAGTDAYLEYNDTLFALKTDLINKVVTEGMSIEAAYAEYDANNGYYMSDAIVASLNAE